MATAIYQKRKPSNPGNCVLKIKNHSNSKLVVELPTDVSPGSYRLTITVTEPSKLSSEPFSVMVFAVR
jgi:hypothetical protein